VLVAGGWLLVAGGWLLVAGYWWLVAGGGMLGRTAVRVCDNRVSASSRAVERVILQSLFA